MYVFSFLLFVPESVIAVLCRSNAKRHHTL